MASTSSASSASSSGTSDTCYYRNGTVATDNVPCPNSENCCPSGDTCMDNGLCRDKNNHANGTLTTFSDGHSYNYTGLYYTPSCLNETYNGCLIECTTYSSDGGDYIWACNDALTSYCCHQSSDALGQGDCCEDGTFSLASPAVLGASATATSTSTSTTISTTLPATAAATTTSISTTLPTTSQASPTETSPSSSNNTSLSTGAKAGIGVGAAVAGILIVVLAALWYRAHRRARSLTDLGGAKNAAEIMSGPHLHVRRELDATPAPPPKRELDATPSQVVTELPAEL